MITKTNNNTGHSVLVQGVGTGATVSVDGNITDHGEGVLVQSNSGGSVLFVGDLDIALDTPGTAVKLDTNTGTSMDFAGKVVINNPAGSTADGFVATGGGTLAAPGTVNSISVDTGQALKIAGMTIDTIGANFGDVNRTGASCIGAIQLETNTGGPITVGNTTDTVGQAGTITSGTNEAIQIIDSANVSITGLIVNNTAGAAGATVTTANNAMTVNLSDLQVNDGAIGIQTIGGGTGALTMTTNDTAINRSTLEGMLFNNVDAGTVQVNHATIDGNNANAAARGVVINDSDASITFDTTTAIRKFSNTDFEVNGGKGTISYAGDIDNTDSDGHSVHVQNVTGGSVTFTADNSINDNNLGMLVENNTGGTIGFNGDYTLNTGANDAVTMTSNTGASISIGNLNIDTTSGQGFVATGGGTLTVVGFNNTITRTAGGVTGSALDIENMTIGAVDFESVNATGGANGVRTVGNTGGTITVGDTGNSAGQGGTITGTADAGVHAENTNVTLNGVTVQNAGDAAGENAVEVFHTNATAMNAALNLLTVNNATAARDGVVVDGTGGSGTFNADVENLAVDVTGDGFVANSGVTLKAGGTNTITSDTGIGLQLTNIAVDPAGANFQSVNVTNGATNGIKLQNVTGGQVAVTGTGATANSGGSISTTGGDAIVLNNVQNVDLQNMQVAAAGGARLEHRPHLHRYDHNGCNDRQLESRYIDGRRNRRSIGQQHPAIQFATLE